MIITVDILKGIAPGSKRTNYKLLPDLARYMNSWFPKYDIDTLQEYRHILSQLAHESDSFNALEEYASGKAYEGRQDLGNVQIGDGVRFKGRGPIQCTGRKNYSLMGIEIGDDPLLFIQNPELLATADYGVHSACVFWDNRKLNDIANMPDVESIWTKKYERKLTPLEYITYRVNGSIKTVPERSIFYQRCKYIIK